jgi:hypothetical protein
MRTEQSTIYLDMSKALGISKDRYEYIMSYIAQMTRDYQGDVADIVKEIPLNLKKKERYFAMFIIGRYASSSFSSVNDERKGEFITDIIEALKISQEMAGLITSDIQNRIPKNTKENINVSTIDIMKKVIDDDLKDIEKCYVAFVLGLIYF